MSTRPTPLTNEQRHRAALQVTAMEKAGIPREQAASAAISAARGNRLDDEGLFIPVRKQ